MKIRCFQVYSFPPLKKLGPKKWFQRRELIQKSHPKWSINLFNVLLQQTANAEYDALHLMKFIAGSPFALPTPTWF